MNPAMLGIGYTYNSGMWYNAIGYYPYTDYVLYFSGLAVKGLRLTKFFLYKLYADNSVKKC